MNNISISQYLHFRRLDETRGITAGWNRFYPAVFVMNDYAMELLDSLRQKKEIPADDETQRFIRELLKFKFAYRGGEDPSKKDFIAMMDAALHDVKTCGDTFFLEKRPFSGLTVVTDECNLGCPYCVARYKFGPKTAGGGIKSKVKLDALHQCFRQLIAKRPETENKPVKVYFSGGEALMEWPVIKELVPWLKETYKDIAFRFHMNTNLTLMTEEIARFLHRFDFKIDISIDGYGGAHDRSRVYNSGKGSFGDVMEKLALYRKFNGSKTLNSFQGTIHDIDTFEPEKVYGMGKYGFVLARLAPNLLRTSLDDASKKAALMAKFLELNQTGSFRVTELFFANAENLLNRDEYQYTFNCRGLSGGFPDVSLKFNLSSLRASLMCPYVREAAVPIDGPGYDIYHPELWRRAYGFITARADALTKNCFSCPLVGLCRGGCIYTGLDNENQLNPAACAYQDKMWALYIRKVASDLT